MSAEMDLYYFDGSSEAAGRLETIRQFFDNERWTILQWPDASAPPHFRMCVRFVGAAPASPARAPALAYITRALSMRTTSEVELAAAGAIFSSVAPSVRDGTILSLSAIFPSKRRIRFDAGVVPSVTVSDEAGQLDEYVVPLDATDRDIAGLQLIQNLEYSFDVRVKFASLDDKSRYVGDALEEYDSFLTGLPPGWRQEGGDFQIQTRSESLRRAWRLCSEDQLDVAVVEHETGVEFLLMTVAVPLLVGVATNAVYDLAKWGLNKWLDKRRGASKLSTFVELERVQKAPDGTVIGSERIRARAPVNDDQLRSIIERFMRDTVPAHQAMRAF